MTNKMNTVPIVFAFDKNLVMPACVCISSLLMNARKDTFYDIFILSPTNAHLERTALNRLTTYYSNCQLHFRTVDDRFAQCYEIRGITISTYYRLLIPELIPEYDKIIYSDVDVIFRMDLSDVYAVALDEKLIAATLDLGMNWTLKGKAYIEKVLHMESGHYVQAGFTIFNSGKMREEHLVDVFMHLSGKKFKYQDQDILNVVCKDRIKYLSPYYNMTDYSTYYAVKEKKKFLSIFTENDRGTCLLSSNLHYNGHKPWKKFSVNFDLWWEVYRKSPFFEEQFYFDFYWGRLNELDQLSLWKRIKILIRYFVYGKRKL